MYKDSTSISSFSKICHAAIAARRVASRQELPRACPVTNFTVSLSTSEPATILGNMIGHEISRSSSCAENSWKNLEGRWEEATSATLCNHITGTVLKIGKNNERAYATIGLPATRPFSKGQLRKAHLLMRVLEKLQPPGDYHAGRYGQGNQVGFSVLGS